MKRLSRVFRCQVNHLRRFVLRIVMNISLYIYPNLYDKMRFKKYTGRKLDLKNPRDLNSKLFWLNRYWQPPVKTLCADKYRMREYLHLKGSDNLAVPLLGVWDKVDDIDFDSLPQKFVLKCNHGCAYNIICTDKQKLDIDATKKQLKLWLKEDYSKYCGERHYSKIKRCVICEQFLDDNVHKVIPDYKVYCYNGMPEYILVCSERHDDGTEAKYATYSLQWERLPYILPEEDFDGDVPRPIFLEELDRLSRILSSDFPFVRLDYYMVNDKIYLGEFTFTPQGNFITYRSDDISIMLGEKLSLINVKR